METSYLYLVGIELARDIELSDGVLLQRGECNPSGGEIIAATIENGGQSEFDLALAAATLRRTKAQLRIDASDHGRLAIKTWNSQWFCICLSCLLETPVMFYFRCEKSLDEFHDAKRLYSVVNNLLPMPARTCFVARDKRDDAERLFKKIELLSGDERFMFVANSYWGYWFHPRPCIQLSTIWTGIEILFRFEHKKKRRLASAISQFLDNPELYKEVERLWDCRCEAVHEGRVSDDDAIRDSAALLASIIKRCIENGTLPEADIVSSGC